MTKAKPVTTFHPTPSAIEELERLARLINRERVRPPWPRFGVLPGHEETARQAFNAAIDQVLDLIEREKNR